MHYLLILVVLAHPSAQVYHVLQQFQEIQLSLKLRGVHLDHFHLAALIHQAVHVLLVGLEYLSHQPFHPALFLQLNPVFLQILAVLVGLAHLVFLVFQVILINQKSLAHLSGLVFLVPQGFLDFLLVLLVQ